ncbi:unnamed protein product [Medioppia subpectinata]|uniref:Uncharacterized protein n=1 Tax=Medioppia subpectinata TaxID=1979941 RepID=A0A7R9KWJ8_9ACAR|nr:unnamed protein product [Medioppia subpectinata]CAG2110036.1 unnamed protein product [Medioppia subpectinata]
MAYCAVYLNRISREKNCPEKPEDPLILEKEIPHDARFSFVDIVPSVHQFSANSQVDYHSFRFLVDTCNSWLKKNPHWEVINCETVKLSYRHNLTTMVSRWEVQTNPATNPWVTPTRGDFETSLKVLRVWIKRREEMVVKEAESETSVLKYMDFEPLRKDGNFENLDDVVSRINAKIRAQNFDGKRLITIESLNVEANGDWKIDTELSVAEESSRHVTIIRLFYEEGSCLEEEIGIADFTPHHLSGGSLFKRPHFEKFSSIIDRASQWLSDNPEINFLNAQSIDIKLKSLTKVDTRVCSHTEHGDYVHILRVAYTKPFEPEVEHTAGPPPPAPIYLSSKIFLVTKQDVLDDVHHRINNWIKDASQVEERFKSRLLSAETVEVFAKDGDERNLEKALEQTFQCNRLGSMNTYAFNAIRVYFDVGFYGRNRSMSTMPSTTLPNNTSPFIAINSDDSPSPKNEFRSRSTSCACM